MTRKAALQAAMELPPEERLELVHEIWDSLAPSVAELPLSDELRDELERRLAEYERNPSDVIPWEQVRAELRGGRK